MNAAAAELGVTFESCRAAAFAKPVKDAKTGLDALRSAAIEKLAALDAPQREHDSVIAGLMGLEVFGARRKWAPATGYLYPTTDAAWRLIQALSS